MSGVARAPASDRTKARSGLQYGRGVTGKSRFRIRQLHIAQHLAPLIAAKALGAVKLDLVLRGVALPPGYEGRREIGFVLPTYAYEDLHDLVRAPDRYGPAGEEVDYSGASRRAKRKWVGEQVGHLEDMNLIRRTGRGGRPELVVLCDDGSGDPFDDPDGKRGGLYITVHGTLISTGVLRTWGAPELTFYLAAMVGEGFDSNARHGDERVRLGGGTWYRPLDWFADRERRRPDDHVRMPFSVPTLERGLARLRKDGFVTSRRIYRDPRTGRRFSRPRNLYENRFWTLEYQDKIPNIRQVLAELRGVENPSAILEPILQGASPAP